MKALAKHAEAADRKDEFDGMDMPEAVARREARLAAIAAAKAKIEARAQGRYEADRAEYEAKMANREAKRKSGKKPRGRDPEPPSPGPSEQDQVNLTDEESRITPVGGKAL